MQDFIGGSDVRLTVQLVWMGLPVVPTIGSVTYTVYDHTGAAIPALTDVAVTTDAATYALNITIPATHNAISGAKRFERRSVAVSLVSNQQGHTFMKQYRLVPLLNHSVTPESVRSFIGINSVELPDESVDLTAAYFYVETDFSPASLATILSSGTLAELAANEAIRARAVIELLPSIRQRLTQMESNGVFQFKRAEIGKFDALEKQAWDRYTSARAVATGTSADDISFVLTTQDVDPLTGA